jgi:5-methylcytosine-specific restriction endonuclease McrA
MPKAPPTFHPRGGTAADRNRAYDRERGGTVRRGLRSSRWHRAAKAHLTQNPLCRYCALEGFVTAATCVDHFWPHRDDVDLFWDRRFWVSSCAHCHSSMKQSVERAGIDALTALAQRLSLPPREGNHS